MRPREHSDLNEISLFRGLQDMICWNFENMMLISFFTVSGYDKCVIFQFSFEENFQIYRWLWGSEGQTLIVKLLD